MATGLIIVVSSWHCNLNEMQAQVTQRFASLAEFYFQHNYLAAPPLPKEKAKERSEVM